MRRDTSEALTVVLKRLKRVELLRQVRTALCKASLAGLRRAVQDHVDLSWYWCQRDAGVGSLRGKTTIRHLDAEFTQRGDKCGLPGAVVPIDDYFLSILHRNFHFSSTSSWEPPARHTSLSNSPMSKWR